jgi:hypothetical protein
LLLVGTKRKRIFLGRTFVCFFKCGAIFFSAALSYLFLSDRFRFLANVIFSFRVARFFMLKHTKTGENIPNNQKIPIPNGHKVYQKAAKYTKWP